MPCQYGGRYWISPTKASSERGGGQAAVHDQRRAHRERADAQAPPARLAPPRRAAGRRAHARHVLRRPFHRPLALLIK